MFVFSCHIMITTIILAQGFVPQLIKTNTMGMHLKNKYYIKIKRSSHVQLCELVILLGLFF